MATIRFETRGGSSLASQILNKGETFYLPSTSSVHKEGCELLGWVNSGGAWCAPGSLQTVKEDNPVYTAYYYLIFDVDDGQGTVAMAEYGEDYNEVYRDAAERAGINIYTDFPIPNRYLPGYTFRYWQAMEDSSLQFRLGDDISHLTRGYRLRSVMIANRYKIQYDLVGGDFPALASQPTSALYDEWFDVSYPEREGYTFGGWEVTGLDPNVRHYMKVPPSGDIYTDTSEFYYGTFADSFKNLSTGGTVTFTAVWEQEVVDVVTSNVAVRTESGWKVGRIEYRTPPGFKSSKSMHIKTYNGWE